VNILVDVSAGRAIAVAVRALGHDVALVSDRDAKLPDEDIQSWAVSEQRLVIPMDKDFGELVFLSGRAHAGFLLLRLEAARTAERVRVTTEVFARYGDQLAGRFSVYQDGRLRIR
jgi:predicted nuclease of predicted toxin-antitoxin system